MTEYVFRLHAAKNCLNYIEKLFIIVRELIYNNNSTADEINNFIVYSKEIDEFMLYVDDFNMFYTNNLKSMYKIKNSPYNICYKKHKQMMKNINPNKLTYKRIIQSKPSHMIGFEMPLFEDIPLLIDLMKKNTNYTNQVMKSIQFIINKTKKHLNNCDVP
jgi:hypothetical protein